MKHLTAKEGNKIRELTLARWPQKRIAVALGRSRETIYLYQKRMGLTWIQHGPRARILTADEQADALALLRSGLSEKAVAMKFETSRWSIHKVAAKFQHRRRSEERRVGKEWRA